MSMATTRTYGSDVEKRRERSRENSMLRMPSRFVQPRIVLCLVTFCLVAFGLLMIYSSSSIKALTSDLFGFNAFYFVQRQAIFVIVGTIAALVVALIDYHHWRGLLLIGTWFVTIALLIAVFFSATGESVYGATRWIKIGPFTLQSSEFAKITVILVAAVLYERCFVERSIDPMQLLKLLAIGAGIPLVLIMFQPDRGTFIICCATIYIMAYLSGLEFLISWKTIIVVAIFAAAIIGSSGYARQRFLTMLNPEADPYNSGYQIMQGFYAFGSGGLTGVGIGMSRQKYSYLPMAYNDFIFAVIGEELGLVGTLLTLFAFVVLAWAGYKIACHAADHLGRLIAAGCTSMIIIQLLVNVCGVLSLIPLSGKPIPFLSYGGSSVISSLLLVGFIASVSLHSNQPKTVYEERRRNWSVTSGRMEDDDEEFALVGEATPRSTRGTAASSGFTVVPGMASSSSSSRSSRLSRSTSPDALRAERSLSESRNGARVSFDARGRRRIDLGPDASERLRSSRDQSRGRR